MDGFFSANSDSLSCDARQGPHQVAQNSMMVTLLAMSFLVNVFFSFIPSKEKSGIGFPVSCFFTTANSSGLASSLIESFIGFLSRSNSTITSYPTPFD